MSLIQVGEEPVCVSYAQDLLLLLCTYLQLKPATLLAALEPHLCCPPPPLGYSLQDLTLSVVSLIDMVKGQLVPEPCAVTLTVSGSV